ncbi:MAG: metallophosphoesterase family protein [Kiloniellales bacterium]
MQIGAGIITMRRLGNPLQGLLMAELRYRVPDDSRVYAVGDIHGRLDLLMAVEDLILEDAAKAPERRKVVVYLGDYVDRGPESRGVIEHLREAPLTGFERVYLIGNHESMMLAFLEDLGAGPGWMWNGGDATLMSYGVAAPTAWTDRNQLEAAQDGLERALPQSHREFLAALVLSHREGDYLFVHAGIRPGVALDKQDPNDLVWIREEFLDSSADHGVMVVHGHTIREQPVRRPNRIGIDTGAYFTGRLTCLILAGDQVTLLQGSGRAGVLW